MFARIALAVPVGAAVTAALLFMMHVLIASGESETRDAATRVVDFVRIERAETIETADRRPERPEAPEPAPEIDLPANDSFASVIEVAMVIGPRIDFGAEIGGVGIEVSDGEYLPIVKVAPVYPMRALQRRLEGHVVVEFVVTTAGTVRDVVVIESTSPVFDQAAIEAAQKFKYKPRIVDGLPIEVAGVQNKITFRLDA